MRSGCDHFLLCYRHCVEERLQWSFPEAPASLMWPRRIVFCNPTIQVGLQLVDRTIHLLAQGNTVELVEHGLLETLADSVGLWALGLGARVIDVLDRLIELVFVPLQIAAILAAAVCQYAQQLDLVLLKERTTRSLSRSAAVIGVLRSYS